MREKVVHRQSTLATGRNKHYDRLVGGVFADGKISRFGHGDHERGEMRDGEGLQVNVEVQRSGAEILC